MAKPENKTKKIWTTEDELEFQMGDMNGIAFEQQTEVKQEVTVVHPEDADSNDRPDFVTPAVPFYEHIDRKKKK